ncbi:MAG: DUF305 domain-containing protein [Blastocatellia bacterium]|nr:DUF305 domain-containing protein [Blastocatellia bacterium]
MRKLVLIIALAFAVGCGSDEGAHDHSHDHSNDHSHDHSSAPVPPADGHLGHFADHANMESSPGAADAPVELQFIDTMIAHHQGAVDMARMVEARGEDPRFKLFASRIVEAQEREITEMKRWRDKWFEGRSEAVNMDFPGMRDGMSGMDMKRLDGLSGRDFDLEFIRQMIPHHEGAVVMARALMDTKNYPELRKLADTIIKEQTAEIEQMRKWEAEWASSQKN